MNWVTKKFYQNKGFRNFKIINHLSRSHVNFGLPLISQHNLHLMDIIDHNQFIDVGPFVKTAVQISDACFEYQHKKKQDGKTW